MMQHFIQKLYGAKKRLPNKTDSGTCVSEVYLKDMKYAV